MSGYSQQLSAHLKQLRNQRGLTLNELAKASGVSRATLSRIEKAEASPTAETLGALSSAYRLPISALLSPLDNVFEPIIRREAQSLWQDDAHGFQRRLVSPPAANLSVEIIEGNLSPHQIISYDGPSMPGHEHHLVMLEGELLLTVDNQQYQLKSGDCIRYKLYGASQYQTQTSPARYLLALSPGI